MNTTTVKQKLSRFLEKVEKRLNSPKKNEAVCYMAYYGIYCIVRISEALTEGDENIAAIISSWMKDNKEKFHFCATEDDFHKMTEQIKRSTDKVMDMETSTGQGSRIDLNEHLHSLIELIPDKKGV